HLPTIIKRRARTLIRSTWLRDKRGAWLALIGVFALPWGIAAGLSTTVPGIFAAYLLYAHPPIWVAYYLELQAPLPFLTAAGAFFIIRAAVRFAGPTLSRPISNRGLGAAPAADPRKQQLQIVVVFSIVALWLMYPTPGLVSVTRHLAMSKAEY